MEKLIDLNSPEVSSVIDKLLVDKTTGKNIIFAEDDYLPYDKLATKEAQITKGFISKYGDEYVTPRVKKHIKLQSDRTRESAEVFTPSWICNQMINYIDEDWFGYKDVFNKQKGESWTTKTGKIDFKGKNWKSYVESTRLEITCGEAPYLVSRYDTSNGKQIPLEERIGILDRKIRVVNENVNDEKEWLEWVFTAYKSVYGYEFQGDNLLIARINLYLTFIEYLNAKFNRKPNTREVDKLIDIICWNIYQMDGLKYITPFGSSKPKSIQMTIFDDEAPKKTHVERYSDVKIFNWIYNKQVLFKDIRKDGNKMNFDYIIGNPPYQEASKGKKISDVSIYNFFMDSAYELSEKVEMITPARFLFENGSTPTAWNKKMLNDPSFKVLFFEPEAKKVFSSVGFMGGIAIHYRDSKKNYGAIKCFTPYNDLNSILNKVVNDDFSSIQQIMFNQNLFKLPNLYAKFPQLKEKISSKGKERRLTSGSIEFVCFSDKPINESYKIAGIQNNARLYKYIKKNYIDAGCINNLFGYKVALPANNGAPAVGGPEATSVIGEPFILEPNCGFTQSFISVGNFKTRKEAEYALKYLKTKFCRCMVGVLKVTQNGKKPMWKYVPIQDFSGGRDIDWTKSIKEIDAQLYNKYSLSKSDVMFIESKIREMK